MKKSPTLGHTGAITKNCLQVVDAVKRNGRFKNYIDISTLITGSANTVTYWRNGKRAVTVEALGKLVDLLNANPVYLLTGKGDLFNVASTDTLIERRLKALEQAVNELQNTIKK